MKQIKQVFLVGISIAVLSGSVLAQEETPRISLDFNEQCNNIFRHYCVSGNHERAVNRMLLIKKERGEKISIRLIKKIARSTPSRTYTPPPQPE